MMTKEFDVAYSTSKITDDYSFELKILAKDDETLNKVFAMIRGDAF